MTCHRIFTAALAAASLMIGTAAADTSTPRGTVEALFDAMRAGDEAAVLSLVADGAPLQRVGTDGSVRDSAFADWASWVGQQEAGDANEITFNVRVRRYGALASVWAPFVLYYKGERRGCGVNEFTLAEQDGAWTIIHGVDTPSRQGCEMFEETRG